MHDLPNSRLYNVQQGMLPDLVINLTEYPRELDLLQDIIDEAGRCWTETQSYRKKVLVLQWREDMRLHAATR